MVLLKLAVKVQIHNLTCISEKLISIGFNKGDLLYYGFTRMIYFLLYFFREVTCISKLT